MTAWGWTGRVTLGRKRSDDFSDDEMTSRVKVDSLIAGRVLYPRDSAWPGYGAICALGPRSGRYVDHLPSLDAAVMWVLRRAAPDVWRAERGPVWRVKPMWHGAAFDGLPDATCRPKAPATGWLAEGPERGDDWAIRDDWRTAVITAERFAKDAVARAATS